jgi:hypothetical protein
VPRLQSGVLAGRTLAVVPVTNDNPLDAVLLVVTGNSRDSVVFAVEDVLDLVGLTILGANGTNQHVVGDVVKMSAVLQPGTGHGDVIRSSLANCLNQDWDLGDVLAVPLLERLEELQTIRSRRNGHGNRAAVLGRVLVGVLSGVVATGGQSVASGLLELELGTIRSGELVSLRGVRKRLLRRKPTCKTTRYDTQVKCTIVNARMAYDHARFASGSHVVKEFTKYITREFDLRGD